MIMRAIGLMSGTSMDGVDIAWLETDGERRLRFGATGFAPYREPDRALLRAALAQAATLRDRAARPGVLAAADAMVVARHAEAVAAFLRANALERETIDLVGFHGQTVVHAPERGLTVQIGDGAALARRLGAPVAYDFRAGDVAAGGQGAPLTPVFHRALVEAAGLAGPVVVLNIGGVANMTVVTPGGDPIACDTGPGNALIDDLMLDRTGAPLDRDGAAAAQGAVDQAALARLLDHPFFATPPPKSLDRNAFSRDAVASLATPDAAATLVAFTAETIARAVALLPARPRAIVVCGGGARNPTLIGAIAARAGVAVTCADAYGWSADALEAQAFAYLAVRAARGLPLTFPTTTGVARPTGGGVIVAPPHEAARQHGERR